MKFAVIGSLGWAGIRHVEALTKLGHEIVAVVDPGDGCAAQAKEIGAVAVASLNDLDLSTIEAATLALPPSLHPAAARKLANAGIHVMCEKPMAPDAKEAQKLVEFAESSDVTIMPGYLLRTNPHIRSFVEGLKTLGPVRRLHISTNVRKPSMAGWRSEPVIGGALLVNAIHQLDLATWFIGEPLTPRMAQLDNVHHEAPTEDLFYTALVSPSGVTASVLSSWSTHPPISNDGLMVTDAGRLRIEAETDSGSIVLTQKGYRINDEDHELDNIVGEKETMVGVNQFLREFEHFVDAIENGTPLWVTVKDNHAVQKLIEDCRAVAIPPAGRIAARR
ncbi:MAG: Gfo/Idh/MocA family oxidoreductase [Sedimentitalea sp.]|uniref:Gfo/Idh/MocA family protein n=1 Tax=Sedimentitalea sp. TaxID=2048915 RepID=UPI003266CFBC